MPKTDQPPRYARALVKGKPRGRVWFRGRWKWLPGAFDSPESRAAYENVVREWERDRETPRSIGLTVAEFALQYLEYAEKRYVKDGKPTSEICNVRSVLRWIVRLFRPLAVRDLHAGHLETFQRELAASGTYNRRTINQHAGRFRRAVKWGVSRRLVPSDVLVSLQAAEPVRRGQLDVRERDSVRTVPLADVQAILPHVPRGLAGVVRFQLHTGCRPGEALIARECDIDATGEVWEYRPATHKTAHRDLSRVIMLGPNARAVVEEFLTSDPRCTLFSSKLGTPYRRDSYRTMLHRACHKAEIQRWNPNQLRHTFGTLVRQQYGLEAAQVVLGHASADVTQVYAERDLAKAREVAQAIG